MHRVRSGTLVAIAACFLLSIMSFGTFMNDEGGQLYGLHNMRQGSLGIEDRPEQFYALCIDMGGQLRCGVLPGSDYSDSTGSLLASAASLPAYFLFAALDPLLSPVTLLLLAWAVSTYVVFLRAVPVLHRWRTGMPWNWMRADPEPGLRGFLRALTPSHAALLLVVGGVLSWGILVQPRLDYGTWGEVFAMQATHAAMTAVAFLLFWRTAEHTVGPRASAFASMLFLLGPIAFWGIGIKYHAPSVFLAVLALWLYQRAGPWHYAAFAVAVVALGNTELALPLLVALAVVETWRIATRAREAGTPLPRVAAMTAGIAAAPVLGAALWQQVVYGHPLGETGAGWSASMAWFEATARFESWSQSLRNVWGVFISSNGIEGHPVALFALTPIAVLAWRRPRGPILWTAAVWILVALTMVIHASHSQGTGFDNRFWVVTLPAWLLLGAHGLRPQLDGMETASLWRAGRSFVVMALMVFAFLWTFGTADIALDETRPDAQLLNVSWFLGTVAWIALLAFALWGDAMRAAWGRMRYERWLGRSLALSVLAPTVWLTMTMLVAHRSIPPWPFLSGREGFSFLLPGLDAFATWVTPHLIP